MTTAARQGFLRDLAITPRPRWRGFNPGSSFLAAGIRVERICIVGGDGDAADECDAARYNSRTAAAAGKA